MLAASAFNGALLDSTFNVFFKLKYDKLYDQMLATPLSHRRHRPRRDRLGPAPRRQLLGGVPGRDGRDGAGRTRGGRCWRCPAALLIGFAFSAVCMALTTYMKSWQDFDKITLVQLPLFLFSATFFPITAFDEWLRWVVEAHAALPRRGALPRAHHRRASPGSPRSRWSTWWRWGCSGCSSSAAGSTRCCSPDLEPDRAGTRHRSMWKWLVGGLALLVVAVGLWAFEPWRLFTSSEIDEPLPERGGRRRARRGPTDPGRRHRRAGAGRAGRR